MRLIDADAINFGEVFGGQSDFAKDIRDSAQGLIDRQPTVFDNEKVIEELKCECDNRLKNWEENLFWNENRKEEGVIKGLSMAITIVEKGGIE